MQLLLIRAEQLAVVNGSLPSSNACTARRFHEAIKGVLTAFVAGGARGPLCSSRMLQNDGLGVDDPEAVKHL